MDTVVAELYSSRKKLQTARFLQMASAGVVWRNVVQRTCVDCQGRGGSFWTRIRLGKAVARPGVRGQDERNKWQQTSFFFLGIQRRRLAPKVEPGEARFGPELDWEKPWRDQVFGAKMSETNGNRRPFFFRDAEAAFGTQSGTSGARRRFLRCRSLFWTGAASGPKLQNSSITTPAVPETILEVGGMASMDLEDHRLQTGSLQMSISNTHH